MLTYGKTNDSEELEIIKALLATFKRLTMTIIANPSAKCI